MKVNKTFELVQCCLKSPCITPAPHSLREGALL